MIEDINNQLSCPYQNPEFGRLGATQKISHEWKYGFLTFDVRLGDTRTTTWEILKEMWQYHPKMTAIYIFENKVSQ